MAGTSTLINPQQEKSKCVSPTLPASQPSRAAAAPLPSLFAAAQPEQRRCS